MPSLFDSLTLRKITLKNRIIVSPMCQYSSQDGFASDWHLVHLGSRAVGGAALVILEASAVSPEGRISPDDLGIWKDAHIDKLKNIPAFIHQQNAIAGIQLAHAGRKASHHSPWKSGKQIAIADGGWKTVAPSAVAYKENEEAPKALTKESIYKIINNFKQAAKRALLAGFKVLEIHAAHGYLIHEFLSPLSNQRDDEYGGAFENRILLLLEIIEAVRMEWPKNYPLFVRISATDWAVGGWNIDESVKLSAILKNKDVDLIDCSSGGLVPGANVPVGPGYQVPFSERIRKEAGICTAAVGLITDAQQAETILQTGQADAIIMAREFLRDPYFPLHAAQQLKKNISWPVQYERAKPKD